MRLAAGHDPAIGAYADALLEHPLPWIKMRQVYALLGLVKKWGASRVDTACAGALEHEAVNVGLIGRMLERGIKHTPAAPALPGTSPGSGLVLPGRFARDPGEFATPPRQKRWCPVSSAAPVTVSPELKALLRQVKLGRSLDTLPERLALARTGQMGHAEFLELVLADEVSRRESTSADRRSRTAGLDPTMTLDRWDDTAKVSYDHAVWHELCWLRFIDAGHNAVIMGPVGLGKTFLATALGHAAVRRRYSVHFERCDRLLKRLCASRLDNSHDTEMRKLLRIDLRVVDDFALQNLDALDTADVYELIVELRRHGRDVQPRADRVAGPSMA
jgi:DNA replication protein DnaC